MTDNTSIFRNACKEGDLNTVKISIKNGADIHSMDEYGLRFAYECGHREIVDHLIENGADISCQDNIIFRWASFRGDLGFVKFLHAKGTQTQVEIDKALNWACMEGHKEIIDYLIKNGANVYNNDNYPMRISERYGHIQIYNYLLDRFFTTRTVELSVKEFLKRKKIIPCDITIWYKNGGFSFDEIIYQKDFDDTFEFIKGYKDCMETVKRIKVKEYIKR